ncbi:MAG: hypothetical protein M1814_004575 [Vezdaea aestivalis]|nr:MAG: hypothetical protein M1814_004575 [Vezdaea aestivalis]
MKLWFSGVLNPTTREGSSRNVACYFTRNVYDTLVPQHLERIKTALKLLPDPGEVPSSGLSFVSRIRGLEQQIQDQKREAEQQKLNAEVEAEQQREEAKQEEEQARQQIERLEKRIEDMINLQLQRASGGSGQYFAASY